MYGVEGNKRKRATPTVLKLNKNSKSSSETSGTVDRPNDETIVANYQAMVVARPTDEVVIIDEVVATNQEVGLFEFVDLTDKLPHEKKNN